MGSKGSLKSPILKDFFFFPPKKGLGRNRSQKGFWGAFRPILESDDPKKHKRREEEALGLKPLGNNLFSNLF